MWGLAAGSLFASAPINSFGNNPHYPAGKNRIVVGNELKADLVIAGGGMGGCAAALAALRNQLSVILTEETDWIGGQSDTTGSTSR